MKLLFADDLTILTDCDHQVQERKMSWKTKLEWFGQKKSSKKTETLECSRGQLTETELRDKKLKQVNSGVHNCETGGREKEVEKKMQPSWMK